jgi:hypothetical protein
VWPAPAARGGREAGEARIEPAESHFFHQFHDFRQTIRVHAEDEAAKGLELQYEFLEKHGRNAEINDILFRDSGCRVIRVPEQTASRKDATLSGLNPVQQDFAAGGIRHADAHAALDQQRKAAARLLRVEKNAASGRAMPVCRGEQRVPLRGSQSRQNGEALEQLPARGILVS